MTRRARRKSKSRSYHIMIRGLNRQTIFEDDEDQIKFTNILSKSKDKSKFLLYGYCMMGNNAHLFQERYKSEVVEDERCLLKVLRYIHQNSIKEGMTSLIEGYK